MKIQFISLHTTKEPWFEAAAESYVKKISPFFAFEYLKLKSKVASRDSAADKIKAETESLLKHLSPSDYVVAFDEKGKAFTSSEDFSRSFIKILGQQRARIVFIVGGPYGLGSEVKQRADLLISLSPMTMNHFVAQVVALEQIYRACTIWKNLPYHNA